MGKNLWRRSQFIAGEDFPWFETKRWETRTEAAI